MQGEIPEEIAASLGGSVEIGPKSTVIGVPRGRAAEACYKVASIPGMYHLSTITGIDSGDSIVLLYHFWEGKRFLVVRTALPRDDPRAESISAKVPAAVLYEAEIQDLLGVTFDGNPYAGKRLLLPDDYPASAPPPLRKEADPKKTREMMGLG